jgi:hypothetical protein
MASRKDLTALRSAFKFSAKDDESLPWELICCPQGTFFYSNYCPFDRNLEQNAMGKFSAIAFVITITAPLPAIAYTQSDADACTPDAMRLCWSAIPDASRITQCLAQNKQQLNPVCSNVFNRPRSAIVDRQRSVKAQRTKY